MDLKTVKIEIGQPKGIGPFKKADYAVFHLDLLHGTQKVVNGLTRRFLVPSGGESPKLSVQDDNLEVTGAKSFDVDLAAVDWDAVNDAIIVGQVAEWSFGPVNQETLDGLPESVRNELVAQADKLYGEQRPLPKSGGVK
jgi:hypothetical protein